MGIMTGLLFLLWVDVTVSSVVDLQKRIIGGEDCKDDERLYHVKLTDFGGGLTCGGSLVSNKWVLTAAHCWELEMKAVVGVHPGSNPKSLIIEAPPQICGDNNKVHDIMLLQLPETITTITPVKLPDCKKIGKGNERPQIVDVVQVAGFAATKPNSQGYKVSRETPKLQCANLKPFPCDDLKTLMDQDLTNFRSWQHWNCYKADGVDTCPGDSGGGVVYREGGTDYIYGVHSFASPLACTRPGAFMDVCKYIDWIKKTIKK